MPWLPGTARPCSYRSPRSGPVVPSLPPTWVIPARPDAVARCVTLLGRSSGAACPRCPATCVTLAASDALALCRTAYLPDRGGPEVSGGRLSGGTEPGRPLSPARNGRMDILATNQLARAFHRDIYAAPGNQANLARFQFLDPASRRFYPDWDLFADIAVAILRTEAGRNPHDKDLHDLVGELSTRSEEFRTRWGAHNVRHHGTGIKRFQHEVVGELTLAFEGLEPAAEPGLTMTIHTAEPGSPFEEGLRLLASWAATHEAPAASQQSTTS